VTGPEQYRLAQDMLAQAWDDSLLHPEDSRTKAQHALVHATLALAAATAMRTCGMGDADRHAWHDVCGAGNQEDQ
jgi:hypothetical protein